MSAELPTERRLLFLFCLGVLAVAVALQRIGDTTSPVDAEAAPAPAASSTGPTIGIDTFCSSYAALAEAYYSAMSPSDDSAAVERVEQAGADFRAVGVAPGMGPMEVAGRDIFVADAVTSVGGSSGESADPDLAVEQLQAFSRYLSTACPGS